MSCGKNKNESSSSQGVGSRRNEGCVCDVVKTILKIQNDAVRNDCDTCGTSCYLEPLGGLVSPARSNADTRVFMLLDKHGKPLKALFMDKEGCFHFTPFFRVEDVFDCCATLRAIAPLEDNKKDVVDCVVDEKTDNLDPHKFDKICFFKKTESCLTVELNDFTAVQCIADVDLNVCN